MAKPLGNAVEVTHVSRQGIWLLAGEREYFLPFDRYPWFLDARIREIHDVKLLRGRHLYWPTLDVDLEMESLEHPERYPLIAAPARLVAEGEPILSTPILPPSCGLRKSKSAVRVSRRKL